MNRTVDQSNGTQRINNNNICSTPVTNGDHLAVKNVSANNNQKYLTSDDFVDSFQNSRHSHADTGSYRNDNVNQARYDVANQQRRDTGSYRSENDGQVRRQTGSYRAENPNQNNTYRNTNQGNVYIPNSVRNNVAARNLTAKTVITGTVRDTSSTIRVQSLQAIQKSNLNEHKAAETHVKQSKIKSFFENLGKKWNTPEQKDYQDTSKTRILPLTVVMAVFTVAVSLMLIVGSSVLLNTTSNQVTQLEYEVTQLEDEGEELQSKLEIKNELADLDKIAAEYGMIAKDYATVKYITLENDDKITNYETTNNETINLDSLLSAFGFKTK